MTTFKMLEPIAFLAWRNGEPCWDGDDCVCEDAVYPIDADDDRESMAVFTATQMQEAYNQGRADMKEAAAQCMEEQDTQAPKHNAKAIRALT